MKYGVPSSVLDKNLTCLDLGCNFMLVVMSVEGRVLSNDVMKGRCS